MIEAEEKDVNKYMAITLSIGAFGTIGAGAVRTRLKEAIDDESSSLYQALADILKPNISFRFLDYRAGNSSYITRVIRNMRARGEKFV